MPTFVEPQVHIVGTTSVDREALILYLLGLDPELSGWARARAEVDDLTLLTEVMGRLCYRSWEPGLNPNVHRVRGDSALYIANLLDQEHGSVFEHVSISFILSNVSRVFTHELVRHRVGTAFSQESMRYVRLDSIPIWLSQDLLDTLDALDPTYPSEYENDAREVLELMEAKQDKWAGRLALDHKDVSFDQKKKATSALRRVFTPTGVATSIGWTVNARELRHVLRLRTSPGAEEEMRLVFDMIAMTCVKRWPMLFGDFSRDAYGAWQAQSRV